MSHPKPRKNLGQHFLTDRNILRKIADFAGVAAGEPVVEVGPGTGTLTEVLLERGCRVLALELDTALAEGLRGRFAGEPRLTVENLDAVKVDLGALLARHGITTPVRVAGNFPYNVGTGIVRKLIPLRGTVSSVCALLQEEVVRRMSAGPGSDDYGYLTLDCRYHAEVAQGFKVHPGSFYPPPKVDSRTVRLDLRPAPLLDPDAERAFFHLVSRGFLHRRKMLAGSLASGAAGAATWKAILAEAGIDGAARPETVGFDAWLRLSQTAARSLPAMVFRNGRHGPDGGRA
ncbi:MAG: ribosomal RNA small subunit methyltransferase A [Acidobacteria bacterium]|nr:ribosomal RNA small subunit methyltransferase A [Acidobacteriota bacterium]